MTLPAQHTTFNTLDNWAIKPPPNQKGKGPERKGYRVMARNMYTIHSVTCLSLHSMCVCVRARVCQCLCECPRARVCAVWWCAFVRRGSSAARALASVSVVVYCVVFHYPRLKHWVLNWNFVLLWVDYESTHASRSSAVSCDDDDELMLNVLRCHLTY